MKHKQNYGTNKNWKEKILAMVAILSFTLSLTTVMAQENVNSTGGNAAGSGGSASYSVGQVEYTYNTGTNGSVAQGVQQPYEISVVIGFDEAKEINLLVSAYPNPTTDDLLLKVDSSSILPIQSMEYQLYDMNGKLLQITKISSNLTSIAMNSLKSATYFLKVIANDKEVKTFKIIKIQ
ncbi:MAG: hypothetical protein AUJ98_01050 [Bacteroidetes bacterium CG2_30_33_31]|nr:MAG: hypothetical protein AUJ98_01050 [Bacteroidetes bacterium CG2_30_33_31]